MAGAADMRRCFEGLAAIIAQQLNQDPFGGALFIFRGRRGHLVKILFWDGQGLVLYAKRLERDQFVWPAMAQKERELASERTFAALAAAKARGAVAGWRSWVSALSGPLCGRRCRIAD